MKTRSGSDPEIKTQTDLVSAITKARQKMKAMKEAKDKSDERYKADVKAAEAELDRLRNQHKRFEVVPTAEEEQRIARANFIRRRLSNLTCEIYALEQDLKEIRERFRDRKRADDYVAEIARLGEEEADLKAELESLGG